MSNIDDTFNNLSRREPAKNGSIYGFEVAFGKTLPSDYVDFLKNTNGADGIVGDHYVILWGVDELILLNQSYQVDRYAKDLLIIGSDGGGEAFGFDTRDLRWSVVEIPFVGMRWSDAHEIGNTFSDFIERLTRRN